MYLASLAILRYGGHTHMTLLGLGKFVGIHPNQTVNSFSVHHTSKRLMGLKKQLCTWKNKCYQLLIQRKGAHFVTNSNVLYNSVVIAYCD